MITRFRFISTVFLVCGLLACGRSEVVSTPSGETPSAETTLSADPASQKALTPATDASVTCPETYAVRFETTQGDIIVDVTREWAPLGAQRFYDLVRTGYFTDVAFFRVIDGFIAQFGIHGDPAVNAQWRQRRFPDDPVRQGNQEGTVTFAMGGPASRTTQVFINFKDNAQLDAMGFAAIGRVRDMATVRKLYSGYGEGAPRGQGPDQMQIQTRGNAYLKEAFPSLDYIRSATLL